jgi:pescadillo protein
MKTSFADNEEIKQMVQRESEHQRSKQLFKDSTIYLNREVPRYVLEYLVLGFGATFGSPSQEAIKESNKKVTHHVMDRPLTSDKQRTDREYVVPQWIADSINNKVLLPVKKYLPGMPAPHHLSPFVDNSSEGYIPLR